MRNVVHLVLVALVAPISAAQAGEPKELAGVKVDAAELEKLFPVKVLAPAHRVFLDGGKNAYLQLRFEYREDIGSRELTEQRRVMGRAAPDPKTGTVARPPCVFFLIDAEGVTLHKTYVQVTQGEFSGKKGDVIRLLLPYAIDHSRIKTISARPGAK